MQKVKQKPEANDWPERRCNFCKTPTNRTVTLSDGLIAGFGQWGHTVVRENPCCGECPRFKAAAKSLGYVEGVDYTLTPVEPSPNLE